MLYQVPRLNVLDYYSLITSIPKKWRDSLSRTTYKLINAEGADLVKEMKQTSKVCKLVYSKLIKKLVYKQKSCEKWEKIFDCTIQTEQWRKYNSLAHKVTLNTKLVSFQYKILQRILCTNRTLKMIGVKRTDQCTFCSSVPETISHLFWECASVRKLWRELSRWLQPILDLEQSLNIKGILFGRTASISQVENLIILRAKYYIYCQRCFGKRLCIQGLRQCILTEYQLEKSIAMENRKEDQFREKWAGIETL